MCRKIVISLAALLGMISVAAAQSLVVAGSVTDLDGYPLEGAAIVVKGSATGTVTNAEGRYEFRVPQNAVLVASYIGYISQEKPVGGEHTINFMLTEDSEFLDDVIVVKAK